MEATGSRHVWVHMFIAHRPTVTLQLYNFQLFRTYRTSSLCTVASRGSSVIAELLVGLRTAVADSQTQLLQVSNTHTHPFNSPFFPRLPRWASTRKVKPIWILLKQETVSGSGISWAICKSVPRSRQITTPAPHHSVLYRPGAFPAAEPTIQYKIIQYKICKAQCCRGFWGVKALKAKLLQVSK